MTALALVTGTAGLVGSRLAERFRREGMSVRALDRHPFDLPGVECVVGDVADREDVERATKGATVIVHCAAVIVGAPAEMERVNAEGTRVLLEAAMRAGCPRFLHLSSGVVYAFEDRGVVDESTPLQKDGPAFYMSKVRGEDAVWAASAQGLPVTVLRPMVILGAHPTGTWSTLIARQLVNREFVMRGDGTGSWPYVHIDNFVDAMIASLRSDRAVAQAYNIADGQTTGREYFDRMCRMLGVDPPVPRQEVAPWRGRYSAAKAERELDWTPRVSYEEAMAETERYLTEIGMIKR